MLAFTVDWDLLGKYQVLTSPWTILPLVAVIAVCAWLIYQFRAWFRDNDDRTDDNLEMLTQFRELHQQGELSEDEYRLIKSRLARAAVGSVTPAGTASETAKVAVGSVQQSDGTDNTGEAGRTDAGSSESRTSDEPPNLKSTE